MENVKTSAKAASRRGQCRDARFMMFHFRGSLGAGGREGKRELVFDGYRVLAWDEEVLQVVMVVQLSATELYT